MSLKINPDFADEGKIHSTNFNSNKKRGEAVIHNSTSSTN